MEYIRATVDDAERVFHLVQDTIKAVYPKFYPQEVVDFFCEHHSQDKILRDIHRNCVFLLLRDGILVGTGSHEGNSITRVYVDPSCQGQGYGSYIMQCLEKEIAAKHETIVLDASLPACRLYEHKGYRTVTHEQRIVANDVVLVYAIMEKQVPTVTTAVCYDGKCFVPRSNTANGEVDGQTRFYYHQSKNVVWAEYAGGDIVKGQLMGTVADNGELDFHYQHLNKQQQARIGHCHSVPRLSDKGKLELAEEWQWLNGDESRGSSVLVELEHFNFEMR